MAAQAKVAMAGQAQVAPTTQAPPMPAEASMPTEASSLETQNLPEFLSPLGFLNYEQTSTEYRFVGDALAELGRVHDRLGSRPAGASGHAGPGHQNRHRT